MSFYNRTNKRNIINIHHLLEKYIHSSLTGLDDFVVTAALEKDIKQVLASMSAPPHNMASQIIPSLPPHVVRYNCFNTPIYTEFLGDGKVSGIYQQSNYNTQFTEIYGKWRGEG
jgi:hypothetical protein